MPDNSQKTLDVAQEAAERTKRRKERLQQRTLLSDCSLMLRYALDESCRIPAELTKDIAAVDVLLIAAGKDPLSDVPPELLKVQSKVDGAPGNLDDILLRVHNALSDLVAPATALSLRETDPELVWWGMPPVVRWAIYGGLFFMVWFLIAVPRPEMPTQPLPKNQTTGSPSPTPTPSPSPRSP